MVNNIEIDTPLPQPDYIRYSRGLITKMKRYSTQYRRFMAKEIERREQLYQEQQDR